MTGASVQTILDADGNAIAWTTDVIVAHVICKMMTEYITNQKKMIDRTDLQLMFVEEIFEQDTENLIELFIQMSGHACPDKLQR